MSAFLDLRIMADRLTIEARLAKEELEAALAACQEQNATEYEPLVPRKKERRPLPPGSINLLTILAGGFPGFGGGTGGGFR